MTPLSNPAPPGPTDGLFMPADHVAVVQQGSAIAIVDLERGVMYATTPFGAEAWASLVGGARAERAVGKAGQVAGRNEGSDAWARIAGFLLDRRIIEPVTRPADHR